MNTIEVIQQVPLPVLEAPVVVTAEQVVVNRGFLVGVEAAKAQFDNLTKNQLPNTLGRTAIFKA